MQGYVSRPDPNNALDGYLIGAVGSALGVIPGVFWANSYVDRKWYR